MRIISPRYEKNIPNPPGVLEVFATASEVCGEDGPMAIFARTVGMRRERKSIQMKRKILLPLGNSIRFIYKKQTTKYFRVYKSRKCGEVKHRKAFIKTIHGFSFYKGQKITIISKKKDS